MGGDAYRGWRHCGWTFQKWLFAFPNHCSTTSCNHHVHIWGQSVTQMHTATVYSVPWKTTTSRRPRLISICPGFLSLAFSLFFLYQTCKYTHTHAIFHPKIQEGKSLILHQPFVLFYSHRHCSLFCFHPSLLNLHFQSKFVPLILCIFSFLWLLFIFFFKTI